MLLQPPAFPSTTLTFSLTCLQWSAVLFTDEVSQLVTSTPSSGTSTSPIYLDLPSPVHPLAPSADSSTTQPSSPTATAATSPLLLPPHPLLDLGLRAPLFDPNRHLYSLVYSVPLLVPYYPRIQNNPLLSSRLLRQPRSSTWSHPLRLLPSARQLLRRHPLQLSSSTWTRHPSPLTKTRLGSPSSSPSTRSKRPRYPRPFKLV